MAMSGAGPRLRRSAGMPVLLFPSGEQRRFTIGRDDRCDMVLGDPTVSRWHAGLRREGAGWLLDDLGSTNGTRLNGWRVRAWVPVRDGDLVSFGAVTFVIGQTGARQGTLRTL
jgi:pSer/pThr/pTyr-binding forkhead associated (FHA) protein